MTNEWEKMYQDAILETDWSKIEEKIQAADNGIRARLHEFSVDHGGTPEENQAIVDALHGLDTLRKEVCCVAGITTDGLARQSSLFILICLRVKSRPMIHSS
jgi:hypothetical protein